MSLLLGKECLKISASARSLAKSLYACVGTFLQACCKELWYYVIALKPALRRSKMLVDRDPCRSMLAKVVD